MLPWVCTVQYSTDCTRCQNVVRTSVTHSAAPQVPLFCSQKTRILSILDHGKGVKMCSELTIEMQSTSQVPLSFIYTT